MEPPPLTPEDPASEKAPRNNLGLFAGRMLIGGTIGIVVAFLAWLATGNGQKTLEVFVCVLLAAAVRTIYTRKYGYVTGLLAAPILLALGLFLLLLAICTNQIRI